MTKNDVTMKEKEEKNATLLAQDFDLRTMRHFGMSKPLVFLSVKQFSIISLLLAGDGLYQMAGGRRIESNALSEMTILCYTPGKSTCIATKVE